jgi:hypothetical protein
VDAAKIDPRITVEFKGQDEEQTEAMIFLIKAFAIAMFLMAIILLTQFNSFYSSLVILFAVVMSTIGVLIGLMITGQPFGIVMSGIGVISLAGIVVNHNIILVGAPTGWAAAGFPPRGDPAHLRPAPAAGVADHRHRHPRPAADGVPRQYRLHHAGGHRRRALDAMVDATFHRHRLRPGLRHRADSDPDALRADDARQHRAVAGDAAG